MTADPADFLRRHPKIVEAFIRFVAELPDRTSTDDQPEMMLATAIELSSALAAVLPAILAAHEAELASRVIGDMEISKIASRFAAAEQDADKKRGPAMWAQAMEKLRETCAAAYLAGRRAGREEAAKVADGYADQNRAAGVKSQRRANRLGNDPFGHGEMAQSAAAELDTAEREARAIATAIRSLP